MRASMLRPGGEPGLTHAGQSSPPTDAARLEASSSLGHDLQQEQNVSLNTPTPAASAQLNASRLHHPWNCPSPASSVASPLRHPSRVYQPAPQGYSAPSLQFPRAKAQHHSYCQSSTPILPSHALTGVPASVQPPSPTPTPMHAPQQSVNSDSQSTHQTPSQLWPKHQPRVAVQYSLAGTTQSPAALDVTTVYTTAPTNGINSPAIPLTPESSAPTTSMAASAYLPTPQSSLDLNQHSHSELRRNATIQPPFAMAGAKGASAIAERVKSRVQRRLPKNKQQNVRETPPIRKPCQQQGNNQCASPSGSMAVSRKRSADTAPVSKPAKKVRTQSVKTTDSNAAAQAKTALNGGQPQTHTNGDLLKAKQATCWRVVPDRTRAEIASYAEPGEDLDWTAVADVKERKRIRLLILARKQKEKTSLAKDAVTGGNYKGAAGVEEYLSNSANITEHTPEIRLALLNQKSRVTDRTRAEIVNYALPNEDLDWTQLEDKSKRSELQKKINRRKELEKRWQAKGEAGSGGDYDGDIGVRRMLGEDPPLGLAAPPNDPRVTEAPKPGDNRVTNWTWAVIECYSEPGEYLDWPRAIDKAARAKMQKIITRRKKSEKVHQAGGGEGSGGDFLGVAGIQAALTRLNDTWTATLVSGPVDKASTQPADAAVDDEDRPDAEASVLVCKNDAPVAEDEEILDDETAADGGELPQLHGNTTVAAITQHSANPRADTRPSSVFSLPESHASQAGTRDGNVHDLARSPRHSSTRINCAPSSDPATENEIEIDDGDTIDAEFEDGKPTNLQTLEGEKSGPLEDAFDGLTQAETWELELELFVNPDHPSDKHFRETCRTGSSEDALKIHGPLQNRKSVERKKPFGKRRMDQLRTEREKILHKRPGSHSRAADTLSETIQADPNPTNSNSADKTQADHLVESTEHDEVAGGAERQYPSPQQTGFHTLASSIGRAAEESENHLQLILERKCLELEQNSVQIRLSTARMKAGHAAPKHHREHDMTFVDELKQVLHAKSLAKENTWTRYLSKRVLELLKVAEPPNTTEALFLSGIDAEKYFAPGQFFDGPVFTQGQQTAELHTLQSFLDEHYDDRIGVHVQDPSTHGNIIEWVKVKSLHDVKTRLLNGREGCANEHAWNLLELANHLEDGVRPKFLNQEDCRLLSKVKFPSKKDKPANGGRNGYDAGWKEVERWALLAEAGALTGPHQDSHGYSTYITVNEGLVGFGWLSQPTEEEREAWINRPDAYTGGRFRYVVLKPGQTVTFPSGTVHFVFRSPSHGNTLSFGGHFLRNSQIDRWSKCILDEKKEPNVTNEDLTESAPGYYKKVEAYVKKAKKEGTEERWGGREAIERFLSRKKEIIHKYPKAGRAISRNLEDGH